MIFLSFGTAAGSASSLGPTLLSTRWSIAFILVQAFGREQSAPRAKRLPVHPVHKTQKLVLLGGQGGKGRQGGNQRIPFIHAYLSLCWRESITCENHGR